MQRRPMREQIAQHTPLKRRASAEQFELAQRMQERDTDEEEVPDSYYPQPMVSSARRYRDANGNQVIQQGNRRIVIHNQPPPKKRGHWLLFIGIGMLAMIPLWFVLYLGGSWWTSQQLHATYQ